MTQNVLIKTADGKWQVANKPATALDQYRLALAIVVWLVALLLTARPLFAMTDDPLVMGEPQYLFQLSYTDAEAAIGRMLAEKGAGNKVDAVMNGHRAESLFSYSKPVSVEVKGLRFDKNSGEWSANLLFLSDADVISAMAVSGHFEEMIEVPVLKREINAGQLISDADVEIRDFPLARTRSDTITDISDMVGKAPVRTISSGRPIRTHEVASPSLVKKNTIVEMHYAAPGMDITTTGQALDEGAKGSVISVRNMASRKIVRAVVEDEGKVNIMPAGTFASAETGHEAD